MTKTFENLISEIKEQITPIESLATSLCTELKTSMERSHSSGLSPVISESNLYINLMNNLKMIDVTAGPIVYSNCSPVWLLSQKAINLYQDLKAEGYYRSN